MEVAQRLNSGHVYAAKSNWLPQTQRIRPRLELHVSPAPNSGVLSGSEEVSWAQLSSVAEGKVPVVWVQGEREEGSVGVSRCLLYCLFPVWTS